MQIKAQFLIKFSNKIKTELMIKQNKSLKLKYFNNYSIIYYYSTLSQIIVENLIEKLTRNREQKL